MLVTAVRVASYCRRRVGAIGPLAAVVLAVPLALLGAGAPPVFDFAVYATGAGCGAITLSGNPYTDSFDSSQGSYTQTKQLNNGNIGVSGNARLNGAAAINGAIFALNTMVGPCQSGTPGISLSGRANVTGGYVQLRAVPPFPGVPVVPPGTQDLRLTSNATLMPGTYRNIAVSGRSTLTLSPGVYNFNSLTLTGGSTLTAAGTGQVIVNVAGSDVSQAVQFSGASIENPSGIPLNFQLIYGGSLPLTLSGGGASYAVVYAPNAPVTLTGEADWYGALVVGTLTDTGGAAIHYDRSLAVPPTITASVSPASNAAGWNNSNVTVSFICSDAIVGIASCSAPVQLTTEGTNQVVTGKAVNQAGLSATVSVTVNIDKTPPVISRAAMPPPNAAGWNNSNVTVTFTCSDSLSGVGVCPAPVAVSTEGAAQRVSGTAQDRAGNTATASLTLNLDKTPPSLAITSPQSGATVNPPSTAVTGTVTDFLSGISSVTCQGSPAIISGSNFTCTVPIVAGPNSIVVQAADVAGNTAQASLSLQGGIPTILSVSPNSGQQGQQNLSVAVTGQFTHFAQGTTTAGFGSGITVASLTVNSSTSATAVINVDPVAATGTRAVTLTTGSEVATLSNGFTVTTPINTCAPPSGLVAWWPAEGNAIDVAGGNNGTLGSDVTFVQGKVGQGFRFPGITYGTPGSAVTAQDSDSLDLSSVTMEGWILINEAALFNSESCCDSVIALKGTIRENYGLYLRNYANVSLELMFDYYNPNFAGGSPRVIPYAGFTRVIAQGSGLTLNEFHHVAVTADGSFIRFYVDGRFVSQEIQPGPLQPNNETFQIGSDSPYGNRFNGIIDELSVYNRALDGTEIQAIYLAGSAGKCKAVPSILSVNPNMAQPGQQNLAVSVTGQFTHFVQGTTQASFGLGISVASLNVISATAATAVLNLDSAAAVGARTVTTTTNTEYASLANSFSVMASIGPSITTVSPNAGSQGQTSLSVSITGQSTHFAQGTTQASFGAGVTVASFAVSSPTSATAVVTIDLGAALGPRTVTLTTSTEVATFVNGFTVIPGTPANQPPTASAGPNQLTPIIPDNLLISEWQSNRIVEYTTSGQYVRDFVPAGSPLTGADSLRFGPDGNLYVTDTTAARKFDGLSGSYLGDFATGLSIGSYNGDIIFDVDGNAFIAEPLADRVSEYSSVGALLRTFTNGISTPEGLAFRPNGSLLVNNTFGGAYRNTTSEINTTTGAFSTFATGLGEPLGITVGPDGRYYISNYTFATSYGGTNPDTVQVVPATGGVSQTFATGTHGAAFLLFTDNKLFVTSFYDSRVYSFAADTGQALGGFYIPVGTREVVGIAVRPSVPAMVFLNGSVTDDGLPSGGGLTSIWSKVSGPGTVTFANPNAPVTTATFSTTGAYVLRLTARDSSLSASSDVTINVPANHPPVVNAGPNKTVASGGALSLTGTATDDGFPSGGVLTVTWSKVSGPGTVVFSNPGARNTTATFGALGAYVLRLSANDSQLSSNSDVLVTVNSANENPVLLSVNPPSVSQGQGGAMSVIGLNTHFAQGTSTLDLGTGIAVNNVQVTCPTCLTAQLSVADTAPTGPHDVTVTTGTEVATLAGGFTVLAGTPIITSFRPTSAQQGQTLTLTVAGKFTHFVQGTTQVSLGTGITIGNVSVSTATDLTVQVTVDPVATVGTRTLMVTTGTEVVSVPNVFTVQPATSVLITLNPGGGQQGQTGLPVSITGQNTHFVQGTSQASFGAGVTVASLAVSSATSATAVVNIDPAAAVGPRTVTVTTNTEMATFANGFTVLAAGPGITLVNPNTGQQGQQNLSIAVTGGLTHFAQGSTQASFGAGITVLSLTVNSATSATAVINIAQAASVGLRDVTFTTGSEVATLPSGFAVNPATSISLISPNTGQQGQQNLSVAISGQSTHFTQSTTTASFGAGVTVASLTVNSPTAAAAVLNIDPAAALGARNVTVTTGSEVISSPNGFTVTAGAGVVTQVNPNSGRQNQQNLSVAITGQLTNFAQGVTTVSFGAGITVGTVSVASPTSLTAQVSIALNAALGTRTVTVTTGTEVASLANAFSVTAAVNQPPVISIAPAWSVALPNRLTATYTVTDDNLPLGGALTVSWDTISTPPGAAVGYQNQTPTSISVGFDTVGTYTLRITATDTQLTASQDITVTVTGAPIPPPTVSITTPVDGAEVTTAVDVTGSVDSQSLSHWVLEYQAPGGTSYRPLATGTTTVANGTLGTFDPTVLLNGIAYVRLTATDTSGQSTTAGPIGLTLTKNQKIGNFTVSFNDLSVPVAGLPIQIVRTYDSRSRSIPGNDFAYGWTLDIKAARMAESVPLGDQWNETHASGLASYCIDPVKVHTLTVTLPDGTTYAFQPSLSPHCQSFAPILQVTVGFTPTGATPPNASLAIAGNNTVTVNGTLGGVTFLDADTFGIFDPDQYILTLPDGRALQISMQSGLQKMTDLNGNTLTVSANGITHSSGKSVTFTRNAAQRITQITDPAGNSINYTYNLVTGDLTSVTDRDNQTTNFTYDASHALLTIQDPRGVQPIRNVYDDTGRLIQHVDAYGNTINYTHNLGTRQEIVTDRLSNVTVNEYDTDGNIVKVTDALGGITARTYDSRGNLLSETNALNQTRSYTYDQNNNRLTEADPLGNTTTYTYNSRNQVLTITDALNRVTTNVYDGNANLVSTKDPAGNLTTYTYNAQGLRTSMTDPLNGATSYQYDASGNLAQQTDPLNHVTAYTYDANGNKLSQAQTRTTSSGAETLLTAYQYDKLNRLIKTTYPDSSTTQIAYNAIGKQSVTMDQLNRQTTYQYDLMGRLTQASYPDGTTESQSYDAEGERVSRTDRAGRTTTSIYDALKRLTQTIYPDNATTTTGYDAIGEVTSVKDAGGNVTQYQYDAAGRRVKVTDALSHKTSFGYDQVGNQVSMTDANGNTTQYQYDADNRRIKVIYEDNTFDTTVYDGLGRTISKTDQAGKTTQFAYDAGGRLIQVTDALGQLTKYTYDEVGNRLTQTDANNHTTTFAYDKLGRRTRRALPLGMAETNTYDLAGNLKTKTDFNGKTTSYAYDSMNRLASKTPDVSFGQAAVSFSYTATGQRQLMVDASGTTNYAYDLRDQLSQKATPQGTLSYTYDAAGNLTSIRSSNLNGTSVNYSYDALNRLSTVVDNRLSAGTTTYSYDAVGNLGGYLYPNGVQTSYQYNTLNRLTNVGIAKGAAVASYAYTLGPTGNRTVVAELDSRQVGYTYDALYRLTQETVTSNPTVNGTIGYQYDPVGNRLQRTSSVTPVPAATYAYDANDRLSTDTYDANGNTTASGGNTYGYDFENHLTTQNAGTVAITYDGDGNRVAKTAGGTTTQYLVDDRNPTGYAQVLEELSGGTVQRVYTYGLSRISQSQAAGTSLYGYDGHGNVRILTDTTGAVTDRYEYDAFGNIISQVGTTPNVYLYSGEQNDVSLSLYYVRARYLNATTGRFWTADRFDGAPADPLSLHKYVYGNGNPVNRSDPSGNLSLTDGVLTTVLLNVLGPVEPLLRFASNLAGDIAGPTYDVLKDQLVENDSGFFKFYQAGVRGALANSRFVVVQFLMGSIKLNGKYIVLSLPHLGISNKEFNFPTWTVDAGDPRNAEYPGLDKSSLYETILTDCPGEGGCNSSGLLSGTWEASVDFKVNVYNRHDFPGADAGYIPITTLDSRFGTVPVPLLSNSWDFHATYVKH